MNKEELIGSVYGEWTILSYNEEVSKEKHRTYYNCKCSCGTIKPVCYNNLKNKKSTNCGCKKKEEADKYGLINEIGNKYGRLTVFERSNDNRYGDKRAYWNCKCDCGNIVYGVCGVELRNKTVQSCGCLSKEMASENMKRTNLCNWQDEEYRRTHSGKNSVHYNPNLTEEERIKGRNIEGYTEWTIAVKRKCGFVCDCCGVKGNGKNLISHHLDGYNWCKEKRTDVENGVCLCVDCHNEFHSKYGKGNNTKEQYIEFKEIKS